MPFWLLVYLLSFHAKSAPIVAPVYVAPQLPPAVYAPCVAHQVAKGRTVVVCQ